MVICIFTYTAILVPSIGRSCLEFIIMMARWTERKGVTFTRIGMGEQFIINGLSCGIVQFKLL